MDEINEVAPEDYTSWYLKSRRSGRLRDWDTGRRRGSGGDTREDKYSGIKAIRTDNGKVMVELMSTERMDVPLGKDDEMFLSCQRRISCSNG